MYQLNLRRALHFLTETINKRNHASFPESHPERFSYGKAIQAKPSGGKA